MKRLKYMLLQTKNSDDNFLKDVYEGQCIQLQQYIMLANGKSKDIEGVNLESSTYYHNDHIGFNFTCSNKLQKDRPTIVIMIPVDAINIEISDKTSAFIRTRIADHCLRVFNPYIDALNVELYNRSRPDKENGKYYIYSPGGEVLMHNTAYFELCPQKNYENGSGNTAYLLDDGGSRPEKMCLCIRMQVQLPQKKIRKIIKMLTHDLPDAVDMFIEEFDCEKLKNVIVLGEKQTAIRTWLKQSDYCAFIANGSILPRSKGTNLPMRNAIPFKSSPEDEIEVCGVIGMGIKRGVTVITGGGYSGKSTLLDAISDGIYDHMEGDGRELCITDETAVKISAEDGRSVKSVNISPFIKWIPSGNPYDFSTEHASGSTSQAANIMEAVNCGAGLLLIDEDKSATNFMIRDKMMKELIEKEPITPFTDRVNELYEQQGVSTILVIGGSSEYLSVADNIYMMDDFIIHDVTKYSKQICEKYGIATDLPIPVKWLQQRRLFSDGFSSYPQGCGTEKLIVSDMGFILIGDERIDIRRLHNIVTQEQLNAVGFMLRMLEVTKKGHKINIEKHIDELYERIEKEGLDCVFSNFFTTCERFLDLPRKYELLAVINRMRKINFKIEGGDV